MFGSGFRRETLTRIEQSQSKDSGCVDVYCLVLLAEEQSDPARIK